MMGNDNGKQFQVCMFKEDVEMMERLVLLHPGKETGGNLFGLWTDNREAVLHVVLGPAIGCTRTEVSFYQSIPYLQRVGKVLTEQFMLCHIGEWHSHHRLHLSEPSSGDSSTVTRNFPRGTCGFLLIIANILPNNKVTLSPYLYKEGQSTYERCEIKLLGRHQSPFKEVDVIRANVQQDEDKSTTVHEYEYRLQLRAREVPKSPTPKPIEKNQEENTFAYMFKEDREMIQKQLGVIQETRIEGDLLGLWTTDCKPVVHIVLEPNNKKVPQPLSTDQPPKVTIQRRGYLVEEYPLEDIGKYILCPREEHEPSPEDTSKMCQEYTGGGVLLLAFWRFGVDGRKSVAISPYLYNKGSEPYKPLVMDYLDAGKVFSQNINDNKGGNKEGSNSDKMDAHDPRVSPNFDQHKYKFV
ncbi:hypothetical protein ACROYT_G018986 [Oculina patagonica]